MSCLSSNANDAGIVRPEEISGLKCEVLENAKAADVLLLIFEVLKLQVSMAFDDAARIMIDSRMKYLEKHYVNLGCAVARSKDGKESGR
jgi:uncharacterized membrane-anchored protein